MEHTLDSIAELLAGLSLRPALDARVLEAAASADAGDKYERLSALLSADPLLAARVLRVANSAFFGRQRNVGSIDAALAVLGTQAVSAIAMASTFDGAFRGVAADREALDSLRQHSLWTAVIARRCAQLGRFGDCSGDDAFIVGLMHDLGSLVQLQLAEQGGPAALLAVDHALLGAALLHDWNLPADLIEAVRVHHDAEAAAGRREVPGVLWAANALANAAAAMPGDADGIADENLARVLGMDAAALGRLAAQAAVDARAIEELVR